MRSMTGFGHGEAVPGGTTVSVDVKTVNGRFLDTNIRLPKELLVLEAAVREAVQKLFSRGRVDVYVNVSAAGTQQDVNQAAIDAYLELASRLAARGVEGALEVDTLLQLPGIVVPREVDYSSEEFVAGLRKALDRALEQVAEGRRVEGEVLQQDLARRVETLSDLVKRIGALSGTVVHHYREKLRQRIAEAGVAQLLDESRLAQELIYYAERSDITEETTRLAAHLERFNHHLFSSGHDGVGKQLDFLCQELNREVTTILSKSPLAEVSRLGVEAKTEIEKMREQVQNVE